MNERVYLYDSTLRDGAQTQGVDFSYSDKVAIAGELDRLGVDYIEGGWPGANPTDTALYAAPPALRHARLVAFGMTRRAGHTAADDPGLAALLASPARVVTLVGKTWDFHVAVALGIAREENLAIITESVAHAAAHVDEVVFDAEHFFDGYRSDSAYALACLHAAYQAGARWIVLCDTNGGTLPHEVERTVGEVCREIPGPRLGIHCHNDTGNAVANSLAAVRAGARQVQGTLNGLGERCGNANLVSIIPSLMLKMGYETGIDAERLAHLSHVSRFLDERLNRAPDRSQPYVGESAFAHKGGLHVSAVAKDPRCYEHIEPERVGNRRHIVVSNQSGRANILARLREAGVAVAPDHPHIPALLEEVKRRELLGYTYDGAEASFELLARSALEGVPEYFRLRSFRVLDERRWDARGELVTLSEATVKAEVAGRVLMTVAEGNGPVNALDSALRKGLVPLYPQLGELKLVDYKVRILDSYAGTGATTRVIIESADGQGARWSTVGVSTNLIDASFHALQDSVVYLLLQRGTVPAKT
jgi:2-isopropylmalate synthase